MITSIKIFRNKGALEQKNFGYLKATRGMRLIWLGPAFLIIRNSIRLLNRGLGHNKLKRGKRYDTAR